MKMLHQHFGFLWMVLWKLWPIGKPAIFALLFFDTGIVTMGQPNVIAWGSNYYGQTNVPTDLTNAVAIAAGDYHSLALKADGTVVAWGAGATINEGSRPSYGQTLVPAGLKDVIAIAARGTLSLALCRDGRVVIWGGDYRNQTKVLPNLTNVAQLSGECIALRNDGTIAAWIYYSGLPDPGLPSGIANVTAVTDKLGVRADGSIVSLGDIPGSSTDFTDAVAAAAGALHGLVLRSDGSLVTWGDNEHGQMGVPKELTNVISIAASELVSLVAQASGRVVEWGEFYEYGSSGQPTYFPARAPSSLSNVVMVATGASHSLALIGRGPPFLTAPLVDRVAFPGGLVYWRTAATGALPLRYQWFFNKEPIPGATNSVMVLANLGEDDWGDYSVQVSNSEGLAISRTARLRKEPALIRQQPQDAVTYLGGSASFTAEVSSGEPLTFQWRFNGANLRGKTNAVLRISEATLADSGAYSLVVSNRYGEITSWEAQLSVNTLAAYTPDPISVFLPPGLTNVLAVAPADDYTVALLGDGRVISWGSAYGNAWNLDVPPNLTNVIAIAAEGGSFGLPHCLALRSDGTVMAWGSTNTGQAEVPINLTNVVSISVGGIAWGAGHSLALRADGTIAAWGYNHSGQTDVPEGLTNVVAVAAGPQHNLALRANGTVVAWGAGNTNKGSGPDFGQSIVPAGLTNVVAIAAGGPGEFGGFSLALLENGTVVAWGDNRRGETDVPKDLTNVVAIAASWSHGLALRADGTLAIWGEFSAPDYIANLTNVVAIASGSTSSQDMFLLGHGPPVTKASLKQARWTPDGFVVSVNTQSGRVYILEYKNSLSEAQWTALPLVAGTGHQLELRDCSAQGGQRFYRVRRW